jgi:flavin-dependent dehydrogenase
MNIFDCVVAGGGPAGSACALALARSGVSVALLERSAYDGTRFGETFPAASAHLLVELDVWDQFLTDDHARSPGTISYWGTALGHGRPSIANPYGDGWHLDRRRFDMTLIRAATDAGVDVRLNCGDVRCTRDGTGWRIAYRDDLLRSKFIVDATGRNAAIARQLGARRIVVDELVSLAAVGECAPHSDPRTVVEATTNGYWYSASLPASRIVVAYFTDRDLLPRASSERKITWKALLDEAEVTRARAANLDAGETRILSAATCRLDSIAGDGWLAVGDAAFALDPLSSLGITNAIAGSMRAASVITSASNPAPYLAWCQQQLDAYESLREKFYGLERRWPHSLFWSRRQRKAA